MLRKRGDIILHGSQRRPCRVERRVGKDTVVLQEMAKDRLGRLRSIGEEGRFSSTWKAVQSDPLFKRK